MDACLFSRILEAIKQLPPDPRVIDPPFSLRAVERVGWGGMALLLDEIGQNLIPAPAGEAQLPPAIIIGRLPSHIDHGIDGRAAADHLAARIGNGAASKARLGLGLKHPIGAGVADGEEVTHGNVEPDPIILPARLEHEYAVLRVGGEAIGQNAPGRTRTGDDIVECSAVPHKRLPFDLMASGERRSGQSVRAGGHCHRPAFPL